MTQKLKLPIGIENFQEIRQMGFYYIDKTKLIEQLLEQWGKVNFYQTTPIWKDIEYEHVKIFL